MVTWLVILIAGWFAVTIVGQAMFTAYYQYQRKRLRQATQRLAGSPPTGRLAIVMAIRGAGPELSSRLEAIDQLDHDDYEIHLIVDHGADPSFTFCESFRARSRRKVLVHVSPLPCTSGALKADRLLWGIAQLAEPIRHVLLIDADVRLYPQLPQQLLFEMSSAEVVCAGGSRWYEIGSRSWPEIVRCIWNAAAIVQMDGYGVPWAGTWMWRREALADPELQRLWSQSFCEDVSLVPLFQRPHFRFVRPPDAVLVNHEPIGWPSLLNFWTRQLLCARLNHWAWPAMCLHAFNGLLLLLVWVAGLICLLGLGEYLNALWMILVLPVYVGVSAALMAWVASDNGPVCASGRSTWLTWTQVFLAIPIAQAVHAYCVWLALRARQIEWSQIQYQVQGRQVRRLGYQPYVSQD